MKKEEFYEVLGDIDERMVSEADKPVRKKHFRWQYVAAAAACLVVCVGAGAALNNAYRKKLPSPTLTVESEPDGTTQSKPADGSESVTTQTTEETKTGVIDSPAAANKYKILAEAVYPEMPAYPEEPMGGSEADWELFNQKSDEWWNANWALRDQPEGYDKGIDSFFKTSVNAYLTEQNGENKVYSPLSLYMALGMTAEVSDGNTRKQILDVLGQDSIEEMRSHAKSVWQSSYKNDGMATSVIANSLWANDKFHCKQSTADSLADNYYASAFSGDPASEEYNELFRDWLNKQTDDLLTDYTRDMKMDPASVLTLASTLNYAGKWQNPFFAKQTEKGTFHAASGDKPCDFMVNGDTTGYYWGDKFGAISLPLTNNGSMRLILPDEGVSPEELFRDEEALTYMTWDGFGEYEKSKYAMVTMTVPKFDISSSIDLIDGLMDMGITDAFDSTVSDFTPITDEVKEIVLSKAEQDARVMIDEEGCRAAAMTVMMMAGAGAPQETVDFVVDRPFVFEIVGDNGLPLFVGVVNDPS